MTDEERSALISAHGERLIEFRVWDKSVVVRSPTPAEFKAFRALLFESNEKKTAAQADLGRVCIVYPSRDEAQVLADSHPGLYDIAGTWAYELATGAENAFLKRLQSS